MPLKSVSASLVADSSVTFLTAQFVAVASVEANAKASYVEASRLIADSLVGAVATSMRAASAPLVSHSLVQTGTVTSTFALDASVVAGSGITPHATTSQLAVGHVVANSSVGAVAYLGTLIEAGSSVASDAVSGYSGAAELTGHGTVVSNSHAVYVASAPVLAQSVIEAVAVAVHPVGSALNGSSALIANAGVFALLSGQAHGVATTSNATLLVTMLLSGRDGGVAITFDAFGQSLSGSTTGHAITSLPNFFQTFFLKGATTGFATVADSAPLPIFGTGKGFGFLDLVVIPLPIDCVPRPISDWSPCECKRHFNLFTHSPFPERRRGWQGDSGGCGCSSSCVNPCIPKQFRWGYLFTLGDLMLYLKEGGNPISPFEVTYTMFRVYPGGTAIPVAPTGKLGVMQNVGVYYAVGAAGENGQPGNWLVRWCYTRTFGGSSTTVDYPFQVVDSISKPIPGDSSCRQQKYGWF